MKKLLFVLPILAITTLVLAWCTDNSIQCTEEQKNAEICTMEYMPVCGNDNVSQKHVVTQKKFVKFLK